MKIWATMTSIVLLSGMLGFGFSPDAFAGHVDDKGKALGCVKGMATNNPHCVRGIDSPCDSITIDGAIDAAELADHLGISIEAAELLIAFALISGGNGNSVIDTPDELIALNLLIDPDC